MFFITKRDTALRSMFEARELGDLQAGEHYDKIGALRELRSITQLPLKPAVAIIDEAIAGRKIVVEGIDRCGIMELARFITVMNGLGFTVAEELDEDKAEYFVAVDDTPAPTLRLEIERRILLNVRSQNFQNQRCGYPPCEIPNTVILSDADVLDLYARTIETNSTPFG